MSETGERTIRTQVPYNYFDGSQGCSLQEMREAVDGFNFVSLGLSAQDGFLSNGSRIAIDPDNHGAPVLTYSGPECQDADEAAAQERAGDELVLHLLRKITGNSLTGPQAGVFKRTATNHIQSHPGFLDRRSIFSVSPQTFEALKERRNRARLISWLVMHKVLGGAGMVGKSYTIAQKVFQIDPRKPYLPSTGNGQLLFQLRKFPDPAVEVADDSNVSQWGTRMQLATTAFALDLIEQGKFPDELLLENPIDTLKSLRYVNNVSNQFPRLEGKSITAAEFHSAMAEAVKDRLDLSPLGFEHAEAWAQFGQDLGRICVAEQHLGMLSERGPDWPAKLKTIWALTASNSVNRQRKSEGQGPEAVDIDLNWDRLGCGFGAKCWRLTIGADAGPSIPPDTPDTRARIRQQVIESQAPGIVPAAFDKIRHSTNGRARMISLPNPSRPTMPPELLDLLSEAAEAEVLASFQVN